MKTYRKVLFGIFLAVLLSITSLAAFEKTNTYTEGQFSDVPATEWYASSVRDAYEYGIMNGNSTTTFSPAGTLTVAEGITIASRIHQTLNNTTIPAASGEWYQRYVDYAIANGFMTADQFDSYDNNIKRFEIAELLAGVCGELPAVNAVNELPDVASGVDYADDVLKLYNGGILTGNDSYGTFAPNSYLLRSEISAMAVRIADSTKRVAKIFEKIEARAFTDSYCIIETIRSSGRNGLANGWNYDNRFDLSNTTGTDKAVVHDMSDENFYALIRDFDPENEGLIHLEITADISSNDNGAYISLENSSEDRLVQLTPKNGKWVLCGTNEAASNVSVVHGSTLRYAIVMEIDLDNNTATAVINNTPVGTVSVPDGEICRLVLGTNKVGQGTISMSHVRMAKNRPMNEHFIVSKNEVGQKPAGWNVTGDFAIEQIRSVLGEDVYSIKADSKAGAVSTATKNFTPVTGNISFETFVLFPEKVDGAAVAVLSDGNEVFRFETKGGKIVLGEYELNDYTANVWQCLHIEADTRTGKAIVKVNGKEKATVDFAVKFLDGVKIEFAPATDAVMWFDDIEVFNLIDHADYPSYPQVAESTDYNVGLNVCYLWRDQQSGEGWDSVSPFPEFDTYLGFYDEGLRETADWELKWMAEHGIDFLHACWYAPYGDLTAPIKRMRVSYSALHDGYMNAKYSDLVDFCIMWENNGQDVTSFEQFKEYIWKYWKEYYFSDPRYARLDNKAVLTVWNNTNMQKAFGGAEGTRKAVEFMNEELKAMGYDGIIILFSTQNVKTVENFKTFDAIGADATYGYHWGNLGYKPDHQINGNRGNVENAQGISHHIPTISIGFNDVGRNETRDPIITAEDHLAVCEDAKDILSTFNTGTWKDNTVMISTWNEYSEGTYVLPTASNGFDYLENVRKVFTNDTSDHSALDVKPTETQIDRVGHLYPPNHAPVRWFQFEKADDADKNGEVSIDELGVVRSFDMSTTSGTSAWKMGFSISGYSTENGVISGTGKSEDFAIMSNDIESFAAADVPVIHIRMKTEKTGKFEVYYTTSADGKWNNKKLKTVEITKANEFVDYYINMTSSSGWIEQISAIRIDPMNAPGYFEISLIELLGYTEEAIKNKPGVRVNGTDLSFTFVPKLLDDGDYEVVGEARHKGFYSMMRVYHEWDRFTGDGVLTIKTRDERELVFKVGSDKVTVDGKEQPLGYTFRLRDGLPVFHIKKLCDLLGYTYEMDGKTVSIKAATDEEFEILKNKVENQWEFDIPGDSDGWNGMNCTIATLNGQIITTASSSDTAVYKNVYFSSSDYTHVVVGVVYEKEIIDNAKPQLFFTTKASTSYTSDKCINGKYETEGKKEGDIVEVVFDVTSSSKFSGVVTGLRFDPFSGLAGAKIDYIRCINDPARLAADNLVEVNDENQWYFDTDGNKESWGGQNATVSVEGGYLKGSATGADPSVKRTVSFDASEYQVMVVGIRYKPILKETPAEMFFTTEASTSWTGDKGVKGRYIIPEDAEIGDIVEVNFDMTTNKNWTGKITNIRVDPFSILDTFEIDYIRLYKKQ